MVIKRTDRVQIQNYAQSGVELFDQIETQLLILVEHTATVNYFGPNAHTFKTACATNAVDFAEATSRTMFRMSYLIEDATSFIAEALGGQRITLEPPSVSVALPTINADEGFEQAESEALHHLRQQVDGLYATIVSLFDQNLKNFDRLGTDGWLGPEYDEARLAMGQLTTLAVDRCDQSRTTMTTTIQQQIDALFG